MIDCVLCENSEWSYKKDSIHGDLYCGFKEKVCDDVPEGECVDYFFDSLTYGCSSR